MPPWAGHGAINALGASKTALAKNAPGYPLRSLGSAILSFLSPESNHIIYYICIRGRGCPLYSPSQQSHRRHQRQQGKYDQCVAPGDYLFREKPHPQHVAGDNESHSGGSHGA